MALPPLVNSFFNLYTDSHYIFRALHVIGTTSCIGTSIGKFMDAVSANSRCHLLKKIAMFIESY